MQTQLIQYREEMATEIWGVQESIRKMQSDFKTVSTLSSEYKETLAKQHKETVQLLYKEL